MARNARACLRSWARREGFHRSLLEIAEAEEDDEEDDEGGAL